MDQQEYIFVYGRTPQLARYEARSVYDQAVFREISAECDWVEQLTHSPDSIMERLGGLIRVAKEIEIIQEITPQTLAKLIYTDQKDAQHELRFVFSNIGSTVNTAKLSFLVKEVLTGLGMSSRFSLATGNLATAAQVSFGHALEYLIIKVEKGFLIARTLSVQNANEWTKRDFDRPKSDAKKGMLPLKVARMVVNIAAGNHTENKCFADPFCGMGSIISEGMLFGDTWYGSDVSEKAVQGTEKNTTWLINEYHLSVKQPKLFIADAVHLSSHIPKHTLDAIVTEPFLGNPGLGEGKIIQDKEILNILKGLEKLYIGCFKDWYDLLKDSGKIVIALPCIQRGEHKQTVKKLIDTCESLGYSIEAGPFDYNRPNATVIRQFYIFKKII